MYFPCLQVQQACALGDLDDAGYFEQIYHDLVLSQHPTLLLADDHPDMVKQFLKGLPPAKDQMKIRRRFEQMAEAHHARMNNFRWWDIARGEIALLATIVRDGQLIALSFFWKRSAKGEYGPFPSIQNSISWVPDPDGLHGRGLRIEATTYQSVKTEFANWLAAPLSMPA